MIGVLSQEEFFKNLPICNEENRAVVTHVNTNIMKLKPKKGYIYACCQTITGEYVYLHDTILLNNKLYRIISMENEGKWMNAMKPENKDIIPLAFEILHGKCELVKGDIK